MARPKGSKNRPKEEREAEKAAKGARKAGIGHNSGSALTNDERTALLIQGLTAIERLQLEAASITSKIRDQRKKLLAHGFTKEEVDFALRLRKNKEGEEQDLWRRLKEVAARLNHPIGTQPDMLDTADKLEGVDLAGKQGMQAGLEAKDCKPPYPADSPEGQMWIEKWHEGQAINASMIKKMEPPAGSEAETTDAFDDALDDAPDGDQAGVSGAGIRAEDDMPDLPPGTRREPEPEQAGA